MRPVDLTSVERQALDQLGSGELLFFDHHNTPWIAKHGRRLIPLVITVQKRKWPSNDTPLTMRSFPIEYVLIEMRLHVDKTFVTHTL
jgi:hypothetical protein